MSDVKVGDVVKLKSGGPKMTVTSIEDHMGTPSVFCEWFDEKNTQQSGVFALTSVKPAGNDSIGSARIYRG